MRPVRNSPVRNSPVRVRPVHARPVHCEPVYGRPVRNSPVRNSPVRNSPVRARPVHGDPAYDCPVQGDPVQGDPVDSGPPVGGPLLGGRVASGLVHSCDIGNGPVHGRAARSRSVPRPIRTGPVLAGPAQDSPIHRGPLRCRGIQRGTVRGAGEGVAVGDHEVAEVDRADPDPQRGRRAGRDGGRSGRRPDRRTTPEQGEEEREHDDRHRQDRDPAVPAGQFHTRTDAEREHGQPEQRQRELTEAQRTLPSGYGPLVHETDGTQGSCHSWFTAATQFLGCLDEGVSELIDASVTERVDEYVTDHLVGTDPVLDAALADSAAAGLPPIAVSAAQGKFLQLLARILRARTVLEIGTLGGYSTICLARGLPAAAGWTRWRSTRRMPRSPGPTSPAPAWPTGSRSPSARP